MPCRYYLIFLIACLSFPIGVNARDMTGKQIMEEQKRRHEVQTEISEEAMLLVDNKGRKEQRIIKTYAKDLGDEQNRFLIVFIIPATVRGTALLTWEHNNRDDDQWLYLPSQRKLQRIAQGSQKSYFMGTDLTYEDLKSDNIDDYTYNTLTSKKIDGHDCYVIEARPATEQKKKESGYARRVLWVRKDIFFSVKIEYYDRRDRHIKTQTNLDLVNLEGTVWRPKKALVDNHKRNHKTLVAVKSIEINIPIGNDLFTERYIMAEKHIQ